MSYVSANLNFLLNTVKKIGTPLSRDFSEIEQLQTSVKGHKEFVAAAKERAAKNIRMELQKGRPNYAVVFDDQKQHDAPFFLVSVLDGITNFIHGIPCFSISIAVVEKGQITAGVIYNPATSDLYFAEKGQGAFKEGFRNHERLRVSARKDLAEALIGRNKEMVLPMAVEERLSGCVSLDLALVASGRLDASVSKGNAPAVIAAGMLLVKEAGGYVYELNQKDIRTDNLSAILASGNIIAVNADLGKKIHELMNK